MSMATAFVGETVNFAQVWEKLREAIIAKGGSEETLARLVHEENQPLLEAIADLLVRTEVKDTNSMAISVDFDQSLQEMIAAGKYDFVSGSILKHVFPLNGQGKVDAEVVLVHLNRYAGTKEAIKAMASLGLAPAKVEHLLALGAQHPELQREHEIVCLGSFMDDSNDNNVLYLGGYRDSRYLAFHWSGGRWHPDVRFAAVRQR